MIIAIIDDIQINLTVMSLLVKQLGAHEVRTFISSKEGLTWALSHDVDLILIDFMMPYPDGPEFIRRFREGKNKDGVPVIMITAAGEREVRYKGLEAGANDFLNKPIDKIEFQTRIRNFLSLRQSHNLLANRVIWLEEKLKSTIQQKKNEDTADPTK